MLLSPSWRTGLTGFGIGVNVLTLLIHTTLGITKFAPELRAHRSPIVQVSRIVFVHFGLVPLMSIVLQAKWARYGLETMHDRILFSCWFLGNIGFGCWYAAAGVGRALFTTVVAPVSALLCLL